MADSEMAREAAEDPKIRDVMGNLAPLGVLLCLAVAGREHGAAAQRVRPPEKLPCSRNELTSFNGAVTSYQRTADRIHLTVRTDWDTVEDFDVRLPRAELLEKRFLLRGATFRKQDLDAVEQAPDKLRPGMRIIVWACEGLQPIFDWRPPTGKNEKKPPTGGRR